MALDGVVHEFRVGQQLALRPAPHFDRDGEQALPGLGLVQRSHHRLDEGVLGLAVERVEPVAEPAERDRVEGQAGHVRGDVDRLVRVQALPLQAQLLGDVDHRIEVALHRPGAEAGQQDVVRGLPQRIVGVGGEQARALVGIAEFPLAEPHELVEAGVVAQVVDHLEAVHDVARPGGGGELEDGAPLAREFDQVLHQGRLLDLEHVAQQRHALGAGDVVQGPRRGRSGGSGHDGVAPTGLDGRAWRSRKTEIRTTHAGKTRTAMGLLVTATSRKAASR